MTLQHRLARLAGLLVLWHAINLLEGMAYSAGVTDGAQRVSDDVLRMEADLRGDEDQAEDDDLEPFDVFALWVPDFGCTVHGLVVCECPSVVIPKAATS